ncbi:MAG: hypothetical protein GC191_08660 [Azospirillum sp.]|nr:hypothetical protein [Azospirillum sp.]
MSLIETFSGRVDVKVVGTSFSQDETSCKVAEGRSIQFEVPREAKIERAFLLWSGSGNKADTAVTIDGVAVTARSSSVLKWGGARGFFQAHADVTAIVAAKRSGVYTVGDLDWNRSLAYCGAKSAFGGAVLIVVYKGKDLPERTVYVHLGQFGGWEAGGTHRIVVPGIKVPRDCGCNCGTCGGSCGTRVVIILIIWEGDRYKGEHLWINGQPFGDNTLNGSTAPNLDIDTYDISDFAHRGESTAVHVDVETYRTGNAWEAFLNQGAVTVVTPCQ